MTMEGKGWANLYINRRALLVSSIGRKWSIDSDILNVTQQSPICLIVFVFYL